MSKFKILNYVIGAIIVEEDGGSFTNKITMSPVEVFSEAQAIDTFKSIRTEVDKMNEKASVEELIEDAANS